MTLLQIDQEGRHAGRARSLWRMLQTQVEALLLGVEPDGRLVGCVRRGQRGKRQQHGGAADRAPRAQRRDLHQDRGERVGLARDRVRLLPGGDWLWSGAGEGGRGSTGKTERTARGFRALRASR